MITLSGLVYKISSFSLTDENGAEIYFLAVKKNDHEKYYVVVKNDFFRSKWREIILQNRKYLFKNLQRSVVEDSINGVKYPVYVVGNDSEVVEEPLTLTQNFENFNQNEFTVETIKNVNNVILGSYHGIVTSVKKEKYAIVELDHTIELRLYYVAQNSNCNFPLCDGDAVKISHCHIIPCDLPDGSAISHILVCCGSSSYEVFRSQESITKSSNLSSGFFYCLTEYSFNQSNIKWLLTIWLKFEEKFKSSLLIKKLHSKRGPICKLIKEIINETSLKIYSKRSQIEEFMKCPENCVVDCSKSLLFENQQFHNRYKFPTIDEVLNLTKSYTSEKGAGWYYKTQHLPNNMILCGILIKGKDGKIYIQDATADIQCILTPLQDFVHYNHIIIVRQSVLVTEFNKITDDLNISERTYAIINSRSIIPLNCVRKNSSSLLNQKSTLHSSCSDHSMIDSILRFNSRDCNYSNVKDFLGSIFKDIDLGSTMTRDCKSFHAPEKVLLLEEILEKKNNFKCNEFIMVKVLDRTLDSSNKRCHDDSPSISVCKLLLSSIQNENLKIWIYIPSTHIIKTFGVLPGSTVLLSGFKLFQSLQFGQPFLRSLQPFHIVVLNIEIDYELRDFKLEKYFTCKESNLKKENCNPESKHNDRVNFLFNGYMKLQMRQSAFIHSRCTIEMILNFSITAKCSSCHTNFVRNKCGYIGCSAMKPYYIYDAKCIISDSSLRAKMFINNKDVKLLLMLKNSECRILENFASLNGQILYKSFQRDAYFMNNIQKLVSTLCNRPSISRQVIVKGRPYLGDGSLKLNVHCISLQEVDAECLQSELHNLHLVS